MIHNYVAEPSQYPTHQKVLGYDNAVAFKNRYERNAKANAELFAMKLMFKKQMLEEHGKNWKKVLRSSCKRPFPFSKSIVSGGKIIAQWN